jgi:hypothetical protein
MCYVYLSALLKAKTTEGKKVEASHERVEIFGESQSIKLIVPVYSPDSRDR